MSRNFVANAGISILPIVAAAALAAWAHSVRHAPRPPDYQLWSAAQDLVPIRAEQISELHEFFTRRGYDWPLSECSDVPPIALVALPGDLASVASAKVRKGLFVRIVLPIVLAENADIRRQRDMLIELISRGVGRWSAQERGFVAELMDWYRVSGDIHSVEIQRLLLRRVDEVPASLVLAQAANESAWGTSRFAREGNNLFGVWTYDESAGLIPVRRPSGSTYAVRVYPTLQDSVRDYMRMLNTLEAYRPLRDIREGERRAARNVHALLLADGLSRYSERGARYISDIKNMIRTSELADLGSAQLRRRNELVEAFWQPLAAPGSGPPQRS